MHFSFLFFSFDLNTHALELDYTPQEQHIYICVLRGIFTWHLRGTHMRLITHERFFFFFFGGDERTMCYSYGTHGTAGPAGPATHLGLGSAYGTNPTDVHVLPRMNGCLAAATCVDERANARPIRVRHHAGVLLLGLCLQMQGGH